MSEWTLHEAMKNFRTVVDAAVDGEPQRVTQRGRSAVVMLAAAEYERLRRLERAGIPTFGKLLLEMPQDDGEFERWPLSVRALED